MSTRSKWLLKKILIEKLDRIIPDLTTIWQTIAVLPANTFEDQISKWHTLEGCIIDLNEWNTQLKVDLEPKDEI